MRKLFLIIVGLMSSPLFYGCSKEMIINLNDADPKLVVEGKVYHGNGPHIVKLSKTVNVMGNDEYPFVKDAVVTLSDSEGNSEVLEHIENGEYHTSSIKGVTGRDYYLEIESEGETYSASSRMPDSINAMISFPYYIDESMASLFLDTGYYVTGNFIDPKNENFYRVHIYEGINREFLGLGWGGSPIQDFELGGGNTEETEVWVDPFRSFNPYDGEDTITIVVTSIDKQSYKYYIALGSSQSGGGGFGSVPQNPPSNISNGALGLFDAVAQTEFTVIIPH